MWVSAGTDRWSWGADDDQHLLVRDGDALVELHGATMHTYRLSAGVTFDPAAPLEGAEFVRTTTEVVPLVRQDLADTDAFALLAKACRGGQAGTRGTVAPRAGGR